MEFNSNKPIYQQIIDFCFGKIINQEWSIEERILSVRELASLLIVNPHTVLKAYDYLQSIKIIYTKRGVGFYLTQDAKELILEIKRKEFFEVKLKDTIETMEVLGIEWKDLENYYKSKKGKL